MYVVLSEGERRHVRKGSATEKWDGLCKVDGLWQGWVC